MTFLFVKKVHYDKYNEGEARCGTPYTVELTHDLSKVTCLKCQQMSGYRSGDWLPWMFSSKSDEIKTVADPERAARYEAEQAPYRERLRREEEYRRSAEKVSQLIKELKEMGKPKRGIFGWLKERIRRKREGQ